MFIALKDSISPKADFFNSPIFKISMVFARTSLVSPINSHFVLKIGILKPKRLSLPDLNNQFYPLI